MLRCIPSATMEELAVKHIIPTSKLPAPAMIGELRSTDGGKDK